MSCWKRSILSLPEEELARRLQEWGQPAFRAGQVFGWLHAKRAGFGEMTNLPAALRERLAGEYNAGIPQVVKKQVSADGTVKYLLGLCDGARVEAVLMHYRHGNTLCISSQVGCRMGCRFCASGQNGLARSLSAGEMVGEVYAAERDSGEKVTGVVLMGIGEPLDNLAEVLAFIRIITSPAGANLPGRGITLSTCGLVPGIEALAAQRLPLTLSVSLHGATNAVRSSMMPVNDAFPLEVLLPACRAYRRQTGRRVTFEYALVRGVNDSAPDAQQLAALLAGMDAHVNLIPVNPVDGSPYGPSDAAAIAAFARQLGALGVNTTVRRRLGADISAACGQLRRQAGE